MKRSTRWLAACLSLSLSACGAEGLDAPPASFQEADTALQALGGTEVVGRHDDGVPFLLRGGALGRTGRAIPGASAREAHALLGPSLARIAPAFQLNAKDLVPQRVHQDESGHTHLRYAQTKAGLPVVGGELIVHLDDQGEVYAVNGSARDGEDVSATPRISPEAARAAALGSTPGGTRAVDEPRLVFVRASAAGRLVLAFEVVVEGAAADTTPVRDHVFISATDGAEVLRTSDIHMMKNRSVCSVGGISSGLCRNETPVATGEPVIDRAYDNAGIFYDCLYFNYGRDSYNNLGAQLKVNVHYSTNYVNAFFDGTKLVCGDGDGVTAGPLCSDPDVVVHEFTHGVFGGMLTYANEGITLGESLSDIYSAVCESWYTGTWSMGPDVWRIGEDIWTPATLGDALRYMQDPALDGSSKDYYSDIYASGTPDYRDATGVPNLAFKLLSTGGTHPRGKTSVTVPAIGADAAGRIFYKAMMDYATPTTTLPQMRTYTMATALTLYGATTQTAVGKAWEAVGVGGPSCTLLTNGVTLSGISGAAGSQQNFCLDVPGGLPATFTMSGGSGDADLYVKFSALPTTVNYDCRPYLSGNNESCVGLSHPTIGRYWVMLRGYATFSGVSLKGQY